MDDTADRPDRELGMRGILGTGLVLALVVGAVLAASWIFVEALQRGRARRDRPPSPVAGADVPRLPPPPRLQVAPPRDLRDLRAREDEVLEGYGWVDRDAGIARIPIERAIDRLAGSAP